MSGLYERVVEAAYPRVRELVGRPGVFLLTPPGSSRGYMLERLLREDKAEGAAIRAYAYPRLAGELRARGLAVEDLPSAEELERDAEERVVVAVESSIQAVELKERLGRRAELIYLPKYFKEAAKDVDKKLLEVAEVEHRGLGAGISPKLLRPGEAEELRRGRDALLALSPGAVGFRDVAREALVSLRFRITSTLLAKLLAPAFAVSAVLQATAPSAAAPLVAFLAKAAGVGREELAGFAARLLELLAGRREPRDKVVAGFAGLVRRALEAEPYVDDDRYEALVDQVALEWGMDVEAFKALVGSLAALAKGRLATGQDLEGLEEAIRREVEGRFREVEDALKDVKTQVSGVLAGVKVAFVGDVEAGHLYHNFVVEGGAPKVKTRVAEGQADVVVDVVTGGSFGRLAEEVLERLGRDGVVLLVGPHGVGKSTLAAYVAWLSLWRGAADAVVSAEEVKTGFASSLENLQRYTGRRFLLLYDPVPVTAYYEPRAMGEEAEKEKERMRRAVEEAVRAAGGGAKALVVLPDKLYRDLLSETKEAVEKYVVNAVLNDVEFLHEVVRRYSTCQDNHRELAEKIAQFNGGYTLAAKYAGLWLKGNGCNAGDVERALEASRRGPKLFFAFYIRDVLLWRSSEEERVRLMYRAAAPLLLHAVFGPVPEGVTYITQAKSDGTFYQPEEIEKLTQPQWDLLKAGLQPIAHWLAQRHEDLVEEVLEDLAGLHREEDREPYKEALSGLIEALDWARGKALNEGGEILAELGVPKKDRGLRASLLAFVNRRLAAVFKGGEGKRCWERAALIAGHALAGHPVLPRREPEDVAEDAGARGAERHRWEQLLEDVTEALGDALEPCAVDAYLTIDGEIPPLSIGVVGFPYYVEALYAGDLSRIRRVRERLGVLSPLADAEAINAAKKTAEGLAARGRRRRVTPSEAFYALGLTALAAGGEADGETADLLLYAAPFAVQDVGHPAAVLPVLAALRPLGEKAPHRYVVTLAAASELRTLDQEAVLYIYGALKRLKDELPKTGHLWPLAAAVRAYSNLLRKHRSYIPEPLEVAVADMCSLYMRVREHEVLGAVVGAYALAVALRHDDLASHVQRLCGLGDLAKAVEAVRKALDGMATRLEELRRIESDMELAEWVATQSVARDVGRVVEGLRSWFIHMQARHKLVHAVDRRSKIDTGKLKEAAEELEKAAEIDRRLEVWDGYLASRGLALRARVIATESWREALKVAERFRELWEEAGRYFESTAGYLEAASYRLGDYLVYLAAFGGREQAKELEELLRKQQTLLEYSQQVSVAARLMLKLLGVGEGVQRGEVVETFKGEFRQEFLPALLMLAGRLQRDEAHKECDELFNAQPPKAELCNIIVAAAADDRVAAERLRSEIESKAPKARPLLEMADGKTLVEVLAPKSSSAWFALMLLAAVEGRAKAVRLHGLQGSMGIKEPLPRRLFSDAYENCSDLDSDGCKLALLKLYYYHY